MSATANMDALATVVNGALIAFSTILSVSLAAYLTYRYARKSSRIRHTTEIEIEHLKRDIDALEKVWELLAFMSHRETERSIVIWREEKGSQQKIYYFRFSNLKAFLFEEMDRTFYLEHAGLHLPNEVKTILFDYCGSLMGLYMKYHNDPISNLEEPIEIRNPELSRKLLSAYDSLNDALRAHLQERYDTLLSVSDS